MSSPETTTMVELEARGMIIGVHRDDEGDWLTCRHEGVECEAEIVGFEAQKVRGDGWLAAGGLLPPGAVAARVLAAGGDWQPATCAGGAWVACVAVDRRRFGAPPVRFLDSAGALVPAPWPPGDGSSAPPRPPTNAPCAARVHGKPAR